jgi:hypothetical protein
MFSFILGCLIREIETMKGHVQLRNILNAFWLSLETVLSIGYGEMIPIDPFGKGLMIILAAISLYLLAYLILIANRKFFLSDNERH